MHREARIANYVLATLAVISLVLMSLPLTGPVQAVKACLNYALDPFSYYGAQGASRLAEAPPHIARLLTAEMQNRLMQEEIKRVAWTKTEADALKTENRRLLAALGLKAPSARAPLWSRVMQRDPLHWYRSFIIDSGADEGVALNAPVLGTAGDHLVALGRVVEVRPRTSLVLLVTDELSSVAAYLTDPPKIEVAVSSIAALGGNASPDAAEDGTAAAAPKRLEGLLQGQGNARLRMNYLAPDALIVKGDLVYTSPTSATFPAEVLIGTVDKVYPLDPFLTFQSVEIRPALDPSQVAEVMILNPLIEQTSSAAAPATAAAPADGQESR